MRPTEVKVLSLGGLSSLVLDGPVPIVFGSGKDAGSLAILSVAAGLIVIAMVYLTLRQTRRMRTPEPIERRALLELRDMGQDSVAVKRRDMRAILPSASAS